MAVRQRFVVISGIPGCGKSTVGRALAQHLDIPYIDKDDILEVLFDALGCPDEEARHRLSRAADQVFETFARKCTAAVLDSFWRHPSADTSSGTPSGWLIDPEIRVVEVFCGCRPELAATRYLERVRHPGHFDSARSPASLVAQSQGLLRALPLGVGTTFEIDTSETIDPADASRLAAQIQEALAGCGNTPDRA